MKFYMLKQYNIENLNNSKCRLKLLEYPFVLWQLKKIQRKWEIKFEHFCVKNFYTKVFRIFFKCPLIN